MINHTLFAQLFDDELYHSARFIQIDNSYRLIIKIQTILQSQHKIDDELQQLFLQNDRNSIYVACLILALAGNKQLGVEQSIHTAWQRFSMEGEIAISLLACLRLADKAFNTHLRAYVQQGLPTIILDTDSAEKDSRYPDNTFIAEHIHLMMEHSPNLYNDVVADIKEPIDILRKQKQRLYSAHYNPTCWIDRFQSKTREIHSKGNIVVIAEIDKAEKALESGLDFDLD